MSRPSAIPGGAVEPNVPARATAVWIGLVLATLLTFWLGTDHPFATTSVGLAASIAIVVGIGKAGFIGLEFMELRHAPRGLRLAFLTWCAVVLVGCLLLHVL